VRIPSILRSVVLASAAAVVFGFSWLLRYNDAEGGFAGLLDDHFFYLVRGFQMLYGELPDRDFVDIGAPLTYALSAGMQLALGRSTWPEIVLCVTLLSSSAALTCIAAARASGSIGLGVLASLFQVALLPRYYNYPKLISYAAAIPATWLLADRPTWPRRILVALVTVAAFLLRHDHGIFIGIFVTLTLLLDRDPSRSRLREVAWYAALVVLFMLPYLVYLEVHGGIATHFITANSWSMRDRGRAPLKWAGFELPGAAASASLAYGVAVLRHNIVALLFYFFVALPFVAAALLPVAGERWRPDFLRWRGRIAALAVLGFLLDVGFLRGALGARIADVSVPQSILVAVVISICWRLMSRAQGDRVITRLAAASALGVIAAIAGTVFAGMGEPLRRSGWLESAGAVVGRAQHATKQLQQTWPLDRWSSPTSQGPIRLAFYLEACTRPTDRVFISPYLPAVPALARRPFSGGHPDLRPGFFDTEADEALFLARFETQSVPVLVMPIDEDRAQFDAGFPRVAAYFESRYERLGERELGDGLRLAFMADRRRIPSGWYDVLDLPCYR
jgi:hypothetical protein